MWHEAQSVGLPSNTPSAWQLMHAAARWAPVSGNEVRLWSKLAPDQFVVLWQLAHAAAAKPELACGGCARS